jgi:hypothetical protein
MPDDTTIWGIIAEFNGPEALLRAAKALHDAGYRKFECHSPFQIHGIEEVLGEKRSKIGYIAGVMALVGGTAAIMLQGWTSAINYPLVISGKPFFSYQAFFPITFAIAVLCAAAGSLIAMIGLINMKLHHPLFNSENFRRASDDGFFISIVAADPSYDFEKTASLLAKLGGTNIEKLTDS